MSLMGKENILIRKVNRRFNFFVDNMKMISKVPTKVCSSSSKDMSNGIIWSNRKCMQSKETIYHEMKNLMYSVANNPNAKFQTRPV